MAVSQRALVGSLLGTAVSDALGLPYEGLSPRRARRLLGAPTQYRLLPNRGLVSDDTEHACMVAQSLIASGNDPDRFANDLGRRLRLWLLGAPAGIGLATLKASVRLCLGVSPHRSGVFSAGNGPAMRSPLLGVAIDDVEQLRRFVRVSTRVTHTDPKAEWGAMAVALAARTASQTSRVEPQSFANELRRALDEPGAEEFHAFDRQSSRDCGRGRLH